MLIILVICLIVIGISLLLIYEKFNNYEKFKNEMLDVPGPLHIPLMGNMHFTQEPEYIFENISIACERFGTTFKFFIGLLPVTVILDKDDIMTVLTKMKKNYFYEFMSSWLGDGLFISEGKNWQIKRKIISSVLHDSQYFQQTLQIFNASSIKLIDELRESNDLNDIEIEPLISRYTLRSTCESAFGTVPNKDELIHYAKDISTYKDILQVRFSKKVWYPSLLYNLTADGRTSKKVSESLKEFTANMIEKRKRSTTSQNISILDMLRRNELENYTFSEKEIQDELNTIIFGGYNKTTSALCFSLLLLASSQDCQNKIYQEIMDVLDGKSLGLDNLPKLTQLDMFIKESLRLYPSMPMILRKSDGFVNSKGMKIPGADFHTIIIYLYNLHRRDDAFPNPEKCDLNRFSPENITKIPSGAYIPFGEGPRSCIGKDIATMEIKAALVAILRNFIIEPVDTPETIIPLLNIALRTMKNIRVKFVPRP